jgi:hypothetical protein
MATATHSKPKPKPTKKNAPVPSQSEAAKGVNTADVFACPECGAVNGLDVTDPLAVMRFMRTFVRDVLPQFATDLSLREAGKGIIGQGDLEIAYGVSEVRKALEKFGETFAAVAKAHNSAKGKFAPGKFIVSFPPDTQLRPAWKGVAVDEAQELATLKKEPFDSDAFEEAIKHNAKYTKQPDKDAVGLKLVESA